MKIKLNNKAICLLARLLLTDSVDVIAWIEEFIMEEWIDIYTSDEFDTLDQALDQEQLTELATKLIGHYNVESTVDNQIVTNLLKQVRC